MRMTGQSRGLERVRPGTWSGTAEAVAAFLGSAAVAGFALETLNDAASYPFSGVVVATAATLLAAGAASLFLVRSWDVESLLAAVLTFFVAYFGVAVVALAGSRAVGGGLSGGPSLHVTALGVAFAAVAVDASRSLR